MQKIKFNFEDLDVWVKAIEFATKVIKLSAVIQTDRKHFRLIEQLECAATSIALNIAEGKGRYSKKEFIQFLCIAKGSLFETITLLIIFEKNNWISAKELDEMKVFSNDIGRMISGLIRFIKASVVLSKTQDQRAKSL
ncbi:MAG: four helix bundle protein [Candidatus Omnitrophica bacterium]|nr:four helix bundle protein [Candidatus Omnitrophota bacterium]